MVALDGAPGNFHLLTRSCNLLFAAKTLRSALSTSTRQSRCCPCVCLWLTISSRHKSWSCRRHRVRCPSPLPRLTLSSFHFLTYSEGIPYHSDDAAFGEHIRVFCFGDERPIRFRRRVIKKEEGTRAETVELHRFSKPVGSRDCYELSGEARHLWQHSVSEGRGKRISVTFRSKA